MASEAVEDFAKDPQECLRYAQEVALRLRLSS